MSFLYTLIDIITTSTSIASITVAGIAPYCILAGWCTWATYNVGLTLVYINAVSVRISIKTTLARALSACWTDTFFVHSTETLVDTLTFETVCTVANKTRMTRAFVASWKVRALRISATRTFLWTFVYIVTKVRRAIFAVTRFTLTAEMSLTDANLVLGANTIMTLAWNTISSSSKVTCFTRTYKTAFFEWFRG